MSLIVKYSPEFSGDCYQKMPSGKSLMGHTIVSDSGLLELMELRLGLPSVAVSAKSRAIDYRRALKAHKSGAFFEPSFEVDSLGVAERMLGWRDSLMMAGWAPAEPWASERLKVLCEVEKDFDAKSYPGESDRWNTVVSELNGSKAFSPQEMIEIWYPKNIISPVIRKAIESSGAAYDYKRETFADDVSKDRIDILSFTELSDAFEYFAQKGVDDGTVVINGDNVRLNSILYKQDCPEISATADDCTPPVTQLFKLGLSLVLRPLNVYNLLAFLQVPFNPLPDYLRTRLASALLKDNGLGEKWHEALNNFFKEDSGKPEKEKREGRVRGLLLDLLDAECTGGKVSADIVRSWCIAMIAWTQKVTVRRDATPKDEQRNAALKALSSSCAAMLQLLDSESGDLDAQDYMHIVGSIYASTSIMVAVPQLGCLDVIGSTHRILSDGAKILWLDCNGGLKISYQYDFLLGEELNELQGKVAIPKKEDSYSYAFNMLKNVLSTAEKVTLVRSQYDCGAPLEEHPAVTLAKQMKVTETPMGELKWEGKIERRYKKTQFEMGEDVIGKFHRVESPSSLEGLMENPDDYYLHYILKLKDLDSTTFADMVPTRGTVAHLVFETMMKDAGKDIAKMCKMTEVEGFHKRVVEAAYQKGPLLLLGENEVDFADFVETLRESIIVLLDILSKNDLTPFGSEYPIDGVDVGLPDPIRGSVDFLATNKAGHFVIIDFKYPRSKGSYYIKKLQEDTSVQLELYSKAVSKMNNDTPVDATAYYLFPLKELHTCFPATFSKGEGVIIEKVNNVATPLFDRIKSGIDARRTEMRGGNVEVPEANPPFAFGKQSAKYEVLKDYTK